MPAKRKPKPILYATKCCGAVLDMRLVPTKSFHHLYDLLPGQDTVQNVRVRRYYHCPTCGERFSITYRAPASYEGVKVDALRRTAGDGTAEESVPQE